MSHIQEGQPRVIAYYSRCLSKAERRYCVTRRELLAVVQSVKHFHHYLYGRKVTVRTDHGALRRLLSFKNPEGQMARWLEVLGTYDLEIQHRAGERHGNADALSCRPCGTCPYCMRQEKKEETCVIPGTVEGQVRHLTHDTAYIVESYTKEQVRNWQRTDPFLGQLMKWSEKGERPPWESIRLEGLLYELTGQCGPRWKFTKVFYT